MYLRDFKCNQGHVFEWCFDSRKAMDKELKDVVCPACGTSEIESEVCGPRVKTESRTVPLHIQKKIASFRQHVNRTAEDVGKDLYQVSQNIRDGKEPDRPLTGSCTREQATELRKNGAVLIDMPPLMDIEKN